MAGKQRGHNEGTITQRKDGRWEARASLVNGKRKCFYGKTRKEVADKLTSALRDQQQGLPAVDERYTVEQLLLRWLEDVQRPRVEPSTFAREETVIRRHLLPALGKHRIAKLTPRDVQEYIGAKSKTLAPATVRLQHSVLHNALNTAVDWGIIARNPADRVRLPKLIKPEHQTLDA